MAFSGLPFYICDLVYYGQRIQIVTKMSSIVLSHKKILGVKFLVTLAA